MSWHQKLESDNLTVLPDHVALLMSMGVLALRWSGVGIDDWTVSLDATNSTHRVSDSQ